MPLSGKLNNLRAKHGLTYQQLADLSEVPVGTVKAIMSGSTTSPGFDTVCALMKAMGESVDAMVGIAPPEITVDEEKLTEDGFTESEIKAILRWAGSEIARGYQSVVAGLEARLNEKDERLAHRTDMVAAEHARAEKDIEDANRRAERAEKRAMRSEIVAFVTMAVFVIMFLVDILVFPRNGWFTR